MPSPLSVPIIVHALVAIAIAHPSHRMFSSIENAASDLTIQPSIFNSKLTHMVTTYVTVQNSRSLAHKRLDVGLLACIRIHELNFCLAD
jgi:hypothetical protein